MTKPILGTVGAGMVGGALCRVFQEHYDFRVYDKDPKKCVQPLDYVLMADIVFVCLPTPTDKKQLKTTYLDQFFESIRGNVRIGKEKPLFVIKSTVPVGTTDRLFAAGWNVVHSAEFLTERCRFVDVHCPAQNVIGVPLLGMGEAPDAGPLYELYCERFPGTDVKVMSAKACEMGKISLNSAFFCKVLFFNMMYMACQQFGVDFEDARSIVLGDGRITNAHHLVPGPDGKFGGGGACISKDSDEFMEMLRLCENACGYEAMQAMKALNCSLRDDV